MKIEKAKLHVVAATLTLGLSLCAFAAAPAKPGQHLVTDADTRAIKSLLDRYTQSVSNGDEKTFRDLLLSEDIPFSATDPLISAKPGVVPNIHRYAEFRESIFRSGTHYKQTFDHIHIDQDGELAAVTLDFVTRAIDGQNGGFGFKVLHLLKIHGDWKIASEFYTAYPLPETH